MPLLFAKCHRNRNQSEIAPPASLRGGTAVGGLLRFEVASELTVQTEEKPEEFTASKDTGEIRVDAPR